MLSLRSSIWNGNDPRPADRFEIWDPIDIPSVFLSGGGGSPASSAGSCPSEFEGGGATSTGERGLLVGIPAMGDGGTKGNDSRIESSPAEADESTDVVESLKFSWNREKARSCCCSRVPAVLFPLVGGETRRALVIRLRLLGVSMVIGVLMVMGVAIPTLTLVALPISAMMDPA